MQLRTTKRDGRDSLVLLPSVEDDPAARYSRQRAELADEKLELARSLSKYGGLVFGIGSSLTSVERRNRQARIAQINLIDQGLARAQRALEKGYQPIDPPSDLWLGRYWQSKAFSKALENRSATITNQWRKPLPLDVLDAFERAKSSGCFDAIVIGSTEKADVQVVSPLEGEPVIIGLVITAPEYSVYFNQRGYHINMVWQYIPENKATGVELFKTFEHKPVKQRQK